MNLYCQNCPNYCEEIIPTFNCKKQMKDKVNVLEEIRDLHATMYHGLQDILKKIEGDSGVTPEVKSEETTSLTVLRDYATLTNNEKEYVLARLLSLGYFGETIDNKLILISLVATFYLAAKKQQAGLTVHTAIDNLIEPQSLAGTPEEIQDFKHKLAAHVMEFSIGITKGNTFGLTSATEIKKKVNEILKLQVPF